MARFAGRKIEDFVGPRELGAADDLEQVVVDLLDGALRAEIERIERAGERFTGTGPDR